MKKGKRGIKTNKFSLHKPYVYGIEILPQSDQIAASLSSGSDRSSSAAGSLALCRSRRRRHWGSPLLVAGSMLSLLDRSRPPFQILIGHESSCELASCLWASRCGLVEFLLFWVNLWLEMVGLKKIGSLQALVAGVRLDVVNLLWFCVNLGMWSLAECLSFLFYWNLRFCGFYRAKSMQKSSVLSNLSLEEPV